MTQPESIFFGPADRPLFGWLHRAGGPARLGLVVCNPFGYEAICAHRGLRHFAEAVAAAGVPALRFDYDGTGDSAGDDREPGRLAAWVSSVHQAADALRAQTGVERIVLLGLRLGALIATRAALERQDVDSLIAIAPVVAGKTYLRELRALQMALSLPSPPADAVVEPDLQEALGFPLTAATKTELSGVDLARLDRAPAPAALLIERDDLPGNDIWPAKLESLGVAVTRQPLPGYVELLQDADRTVVPVLMVRAAADWARARADLLGAPAVAPPVGGASRTARFGDVVETAELIDPARRLFGILSTPATQPAARHGLLLLNAGAIHHVGPNRLHVTLARRWAARGHAVLRLDLSGIGDTPARPGDRENIVYTERAQEDITAALRFLRQQPGVADVHALGLCSGGYHAFKAAVAGVPLDGVLLINPLTFFFKPEVAEKEGEAAISGETTRYLQRLRDREAWRKLLRNGVNLRTPIQIISRFAANQLKGRAAQLARRAGMKIGDDLPGELKTITGRRIALRFVFSASDPGRGLLNLHGGATAERLQREGQLSIEVIDASDHTFTPLWSHGALTSALARHFDELPGA